MMTMSNDSHYTVNLVKLATDKTLDFYLQMTRFSYFVAASAPFPVASFAKLTVPSESLQCHTK